MTHHNEITPWSRLGDPDALRKAVDAAIDESSRSQRPFALIRCTISTESGPPKTIDSALTERTAGRRSPNDSGGSRPNGEYHEDEGETVIVGRIRRHLRSSDAVIHVSDGAVFVVAQDIGDAQDGVGVAYRALSAAVEPVALPLRSTLYAMTIGVVIADGSNDSEQTLSAVDIAISQALIDGTGGIEHSDIRISPNPGQRPAI